MANRDYFFVQKDLLIRYLNSSENKNKVINKIDKIYFIFTIISGEAEVKYNKQTFRLKKGDVLYANKNEKIKVKIKSKHSEFFTIEFEAKIFHELDKKNDILIPFSYSQKDNIKILNIKNQKEEFFFAVKNIVRVMKKQSFRALVISAVLQLISEVYYVFEENNLNQIKDTDSSFTKLYRYIDDHIYEKLTLESVSENIFISKRNITNIIRRISKCSFHELITNMRLEKSEDLVKNNYHTMIEIADKCGFDNYSTFYRAFKKKFNMSPIEYRAQAHKNNNK